MLPLLSGQESVAISNASGARILFVDNGSGWQWSGLTTPDGAGGWTLREGELVVGAGDATDALGAGWALAAATDTQVVLECDAATSGLQVRRVFSFGAAPHVVRIATWLRSAGGAKLLGRVGLLTLRVEGESFRTTGPSPGSFPVFGDGLFAGVEDVCAESRGNGDEVRLWQTPDLSVGEEWQLVATAVVGWHAPRAALFMPGESRTRDAFLQYLDTIRVQPAGINLHSDTWWTLPLPYTEADILQDIAALRRGFFDRTGMFFDTYALDLGWSDPRSLWGIDERNLPRGFTVIGERLAELGARAGLWVSPSSGYAPGLDNGWLATQGYEMTPVGEEGDEVACFALGGRYQREFTEKVVGYARQYNLGHVIFDGLVPSCDNAGHLHATGTGSVYAIAAGFKDVMDRLRQNNPRIVLEPLSCGHPPSPWWTQHTPFLLGPAGDDVPYGRVPCPDWTESLISARDIAYRARQEEWLVRTQSLETFDIIRQSPGVFQNMAVMAVGRGRWFVSCNLRPELMSATDWDFLAALIRWQRDNQRHLTDARMFGGSAVQRQAYGYFFHNAEKDLYCIRNPWMEARTVQLPNGVREAADVRMIYPRRELSARLQPGAAGPNITLGPYETMFLETTPASDGEVPAAAEAPRAEVGAVTSDVFVSDAEDPQPHIDYHWSARLDVPDVAATELCVLVEGSAEVAGTECTAWVNGRRLRLTAQKSAGQFGAAVDASPENWVWFTGELRAGERDVAVNLSLPVARASIGVFLRGQVAATSDAAPADAIAFPVFRADRRPWSQTLQALKEFK